MKERVTSPLPIGREEGLPTGREEGLPIGSEEVTGKIRQLWHCAVSLYLHFWRILPRSREGGGGVLHRLEHMQRSRHVNRTIHATFRLAL
jgi:hypothetical protein